MKHIIIFLIILFFANTSLAEDSDKATQHLRVRLQTVSDNFFDFSSVLELPNFSNKTKASALTLIGFSINKPKYNIGLHVGTLISKQTPQLVLDLRNTLVIKDKVYNWVNIRWDNVSNLVFSSIYSFYMADFYIKNFAFGVETENSFYINEELEDDYSFGPNILFKVSDNSRIDFSYQKHTNLENQFWFRLNMNI